MGRAREFVIELRDLYPLHDTWTYATVYYSPEPEGGEIEAIEDETGRIWSTTELSAFDRLKVEMDLIQNLNADRLFSAYVDDEPTARKERA